MSILRGDFAPDQVAAIEAAMESAGLPFASAVRMLIDYGINARQGYRMATESLPGETSKEEGEGETPESQDPTVIETEREGCGENGESVSVPKRSRKIPVAIPDPPAEIDSPELRAFLPEFVEYRRKVKKSPLAPAGWSLLFNRLKHAGREHAVLALRYSISNNWKSFDVEWLKGKSWATIASELGLSLEAEKPALSPVDLAARDLKRVVLAAEKKIRDVIAPASDGWLTSTRTVFFDNLDRCASEVEVEAHLAACRALCDRLRAMGAFPLRRPTQPGEILPAGGGGPLAVDLRTGTVTASDWPPSGWVVNNQDWPAGEGEHLVPVDEDPASSAWAPGINTACPDGGRHDWGPNGKCGRCGELVGGLPYRDCNANPPADAIKTAHSRLVENGMLAINATSDNASAPPVGFEKTIDDERRHSPDCKILRGGWSCDCGMPTKAQLDAKMAVRGRRGRVADSQHAFESHPQSVHCIHCGMPRDHIRHYLPQKLPFWDQSDGTGLDPDEERRRLDDLMAKEAPEFWDKNLSQDEEESDVHD